MYFGCFVYKPARSSTTQKKVGCLIHRSVLRQEISYEERLRNDLFCVEWDVEP